MPSKTQMVEEFQRWMIDQDYEEEYIQDVYLDKNESNGCVPDEYIEDDVNDAIRIKFSRVLNFISDRLKEKRITKGYPVPIVDPSWEDSSGIFLFYGKVIIYQQYIKAWHFRFDSRKELDDALWEIWEICVKNINAIVHANDLIQLKQYLGEEAIYA